MKTKTVAKKNYLKGLELLTDIVLADSCTFIRDDYEFLINVGTEAINRLSKHTVTNSTITKEKFMHHVMKYGINQPTKPLDIKNPPGGLPELKEDAYLPMPKCKPPKGSFPKDNSLPMTAIQILCKLRDMGITEEMVVESGILRYK